MEKGGDIIVIVLVWGILIFLAFQSLSAFDKNDANFLALTFSALEKSFANQKEIKGIISIGSEKGDFKEAIVHFNKKIDIFDFAVSRENPSMIFAGSDYGLFISRDKGLNWRNFSDKNGKIDFRAKVYKILFSQPNQVFISILKDGKGIVYQGQDDFSSLKKILEFDNAVVKNFVLFQNNLYAGLSDGKLIIYSLENQNFRILTKFDSAIEKIKISDQGLIYLALRQDGFFISKNNGESFERAKFLDDFSGAGKINDFAIDSKENIIYAATDYGFIRSKDAGESWQFFKFLPTEKRKFSAVSLKNSDEIFTSDYNKIYKSFDIGKNWQIFYPEIKDSRTISAIAIDEERIIAGSRD